MKYVEGRQYEENLTAVNSFWGEGLKTIVFQDNEGTNLYWSTKPYIAACKYLRKKDNYRFRVKSVFKGHVEITRVKSEFTTRMAKKVNEKKFRKKMKEVPEDMDMLKERKKK